MPNLSHKIEKTLGYVGLVKLSANYFDDGIKEVQKAFFTK